MTIPQGNEQPLWQPSTNRKQQANITHYMHWLEREQGLHFASREDVWHWSVIRLEDFWASLWNYYRIQASQSYTSVLEKRIMPGAAWFPGAELNYAEHVFRNATTERPALLFRSERQELQEVSWQTLKTQVAALARSLRALGVGRGDRVVGYLPTIPQTTIAFLASASIGAIWSSCPPDFGVSSVIDRFQQIEPKVLFAVDGYQYGGKIFDRRPALAEIQAALPTLQKIVLVPYLSSEVSTPGLSHVVSWQEMLHGPEAELTFEQVPFSYPLWILYSSGTTGLPKPIVQGHGGILLEHLKTLSLECDLKPGDRFFWYTTTGWMMWNFLTGALLVGCVVLLYDGSPAYPDMGLLWRFAEESKMTFFGTSAAYIASCMKAAIVPSQIAHLQKLRALGSTGSPLSPEGFRWIYAQVKSDLWLNSISGGTDVCSAFLGGSVLLPVFAGELQCRFLGAKVEAFDEQGNALIDEVGELVLTEPMPSMPLFFWQDPGGVRYRESYFAMYPGVWRHGDWLKITPRGSAIIYGRSDSTINRAGIRMGSSEIYRVVESFPEILDSLIVGIERPGGGYYLPLFVVLSPSAVLDAELKTSIKARLRSEISPHHVPDDIQTIPEVPRTLSGKKLEVPIKKLFMGIPLEKALSTDAMSNPTSLQYFVDLAQKL